MGKKKGNTEALRHGVLSCYPNYPFSVYHKNLIKGLCQNPVHGEEKSPDRGDSPVRESNVHGP